MHNFLTNQYNSGNCSNSGSYAQEQANVSATYCVSGNGLLPAGQDFVIAQNPTPAAPISNGTGIIVLPVDNMVHFVNTTAAAINSTVTEIWGIGSFQATTPGVYEYFCHYHVSNGMFGYLVVSPNDYCSTNAKTLRVECNGRLVYLVELQRNLFSRPFYQQTSILIRRN